MSIAFQYWYLMQGGEGLPAGAIAYKNRVEADGGTTTSLGCVPNEIWARYSDSPAAPDIVQLYLDRIAADGGTALLSKAEIEALLPPDWQNASFLNIPSARKAGTLYSIIGSDFTVTRPSTAREFTSASLFSSAAIDSPRISFAGGYKGYRSESERTNLRAWSSDYSERTFGESAGITTLVLGTSIIEGGKAVQVRETATTGSHYLRANPDTTLTATTVYTSSTVFSLTANKSFIYISLDGQSAAVRYNVRTGALIDVVGVDYISSKLTILSSGIVELEDIVYMLSITFTASGHIGRPLMFLTDGTGGLSYAGDTNEGLTAYHHQFESALYATNPIVTDAGVVTRSKDIATLSGAGAQIGELDSTVFVKFNASNFGELRTALTIDGAEGSLKFQKLANNDISVTLLNGATTVFSIVISGSLTGLQKLAVAYSNAGYISSLNGATGASGTLVDTQPPLTDITLGADSDNTLHWNDTIATVALWKGAKDQTQINEMTA